jgi:hypothetical protein
MEPNGTLRPLYWAGLFAALLVAGGLPILSASDLNGSSLSKEEAAVAELMASAAAPVSE